MNRKEEDTSMETFRPPTDPACSTAAAETGAKGDYWYALIPEAKAASFLGFTVRCLQNWRYRGGGPTYIATPRIRYRRSDLKSWADKRLRISTSDPGQEAS